MKFKTLSVLSVLLFIAVAVSTFLSTDAFPTVASVVHGISGHGGSLPIFCIGMAATAFPTLLDVAKLDKGSGYDVISEVIENHDEVNTFPVVTQEPTTLEVTVLTELPSGGSFRKANEGVMPSKPGWTNKEFPMAILDRRVEVDKLGTYDKAKDKARLLVQLSAPQMTKALNDVAKQIWYGKLNDANNGFPGLIAQMSSDADHNVDVTGAADKSSVFFLEVRPTVCELVFGANNTLTMADEWWQETIYDDKMKRLLGLVNQIQGHAGFRLLNIHRAVRIKNIGIAAGKTLTDDHMYAGLALCEDLGFKPTHIFGNSRSFEQLRQSRVTDQNKTPVRISEFEGVPVVRSINISKSEA